MNFFTIPEHPSTSFTMQLAAIGEACRRNGEKWAAERRAEKKERELMALEENKSREYVSELEKLRAHTEAVEVRREMRTQDRLETWVSESSQKQLEMDDIINILITEADDRKASRKKKKK